MTAPRGVKALPSTLILLTVVALPTVTCSPRPARVAPDHGSAAGGEVVRIHDGDLAGHGGALVLFGMHPATGVVIEDRNVMRVVSPPATEYGGPAVAIHIRFADGETRDFPAAFRYSAPAVSVKTKEKGR